MAPVCQGLRGTVIKVMVRANHEHLVVAIEQAAGGAATSSSANLPLARPVYPAGI